MTNSSKYYITDFGRLYVPLKLPGYKKDYNLSSNQVMRCEHDTETLGLTVLDEPAALQSDPTILDLQVSLVLYIWLDGF